MQFVSLGLVADFKIGWANLLYELGGENVTMVAMLEVNRCN